MRIAIVTDAWSPQVNGVVRTLEAIRAELERGGDMVEVISPDRYPRVACPTYPEIKLALVSVGAIGRRIARFGADAVHIATEGPLGLAARRWCIAAGQRFTTAYHTHFPDYLATRGLLPPAVAWRYLRWFHRPADAVLAATPTLRATLAAHGIGHTRPWGRGVDLARFHPGVAPDAALARLPRPLLLNVGRVACEKNIEAFLDCPARGSKVVVGEGPALARLRAAYPSVSFVGRLEGRALAAAYAAADVLVFPSRTDTFGLVMIEALACGTPVAAFPVPGPRDVLDDGAGAMDEDLAAAVRRALTRDRAGCAAYARRFSWAASAAEFRAALVPAAAPFALAA